MAASPSLTLPARMTAAAERGGVVRFVSGDSIDAVSWAELLNDALRLAGTLARRGVGPGAHVALLGTTSRSLTTTIQATWLAGGTVMVLPLPMRLGSVEEFVTQTRTRILAGDTALLVIDDDLAAFYEPAPGDPEIVLMRELFADAANNRPDAFTIPTIDPDSLAVLQFTSGSTSDPKGVMLPHRTVVANLDAATTAAELTSDDVGGLVAAAVPRHGSDRTLHVADGVRHRPRARLPAGLHGFAAAVARVDLRLRRNLHGGAELLLRAGGARAPPRRGLGPVVVAPRAQRCRARQPVHRARLLRGRRGVRFARRRRLPGIRHGGAGYRRHLPQAGYRVFGSTPWTHVSSSRDRYAAPVADENAAGRHRFRLARSRRARSRDPHRRSRDRHGDARARSGRARDPRARRSRRATTTVPTRRRRRSAASGCEPAISATSSTASSCCAAASRT